MDKVDHPNYASDLHRKRGSMFGTKKPDPASAEILEEIRELKREVTALKGEKEALTEARKAERDIITVKKELSDLQIAYDREKEKHDREIRETEHMVGLQRKRGEFEREQGVAEAKLAVREENLEAAHTRFTEQMEFTKAQFDQQFEALNSLLEKVIERMPTTRQLISVGRNGEDDA